MKMRYLGCRNVFSRNQKDWSADEADMRAAGFYKIAGIDEAGRGSLCAEVVVACVMLHSGHSIKGLKDSKQLSRSRREVLYNEIMGQSLSISIASATHSEIDRVNIYQATKLCVYKSIENMTINPEFVFIDGLFDLDNLITPHMCVPGADGAHITENFGAAKKVIGHHYENVAAASIIAKVYRDRLMLTYAEAYPQYGFDKNMGYGTKDHIEAIKKHGLCDIHRRTFGICKGF